MMDNIQLQRFLVILLGAIVAWVVYYIAENIAYEKSAATRVRQMIADRSSSIFDRDGQKVATKLGISLASWKSTLHWAQIGGSFLNWSVGGIFARGLMMASGVVIAILLFGLPLFAWLLVLILFFMPYLQIRGKANEIRKQVKRLLPETATVIAAEMDAGSTAGQALERAAELPGPLGKILSDAVSQARQSNRGMFSRGQSKGILLEKLEEHQLLELNRFAMQLDRVAAKGVDAPRIMVEIARGLAREYRSHVQQTAANMDSELLMPMTLFFFLPFMIVILAPLMTTITSMF
jgi:Flp pilus assembly protein TadB